MESIYKILICFGLCASLVAADYVGSSTNEITGLLWKQGPLRLVRNPSTGTFAVQFTGYYQRPGWQLYVAEDKVSLKKEDGEFTVYVPIDTNRFIVQFFARGPRGATEFETIHVSLNKFFPENNSYRRPKSWLERQSRNISMNLGLGSTYVSYSQTDLDLIKETNLTGRLDLVYVLDPGYWTFESSAFTSFVSFDHPAIAGPGMHTWGADARFGYALNFWEGTGALILLGGVYGLGTFGTDNIGYGGILGPEFFPALRYNFSGGNSASLFAKYSLILTGTGLLRADNNYMAIGGNYYFKPMRTGFLRGVPLGVNFEITRLKLNVLRGDTTTMTYTAGLNLMF